MKKAIVLFLLLLAAWLTGAGVAYAPQWQQAQLLQQDGLMLFPRALAVTDQTFINQQGQRMALSELQGRNVLLFFGYTFCPDICPTTLADLSRT
jgi:protein SCO1/2